MNDGSDVLSRDLEEQYFSAGFLHVAGVDEAGRGCLAGPVVAAACVLPRGVTRIRGVNDSKRLSVAQREQALLSIYEHALAVGIGAASVREIERLNIRRASILAMYRALAKIESWDVALCDGLPQPEFEKGRHVGVVHGDALCLSIACASIVAKVTRDRLMSRIASFYPDYGWERNAGYGTRSHLDALRDTGITPFHRRTYKPVAQLSFAFPEVDV